MSDEHYDQWLEDLKVGDRVVVEEYYVSRVLHISEVVKVTPKGGIRIKGYESWLFKNGHSRSGEYGSYYLREPTQERINQINMSNRRSKLRQMDWAKVDDGVVKNVYELVVA